MYVSIMKNNRFPLGTPHWGSELELNQLFNILTLPHTHILDNKYFWNSEWDKLPFCILDCDVSLHDYEVEPPVGYKINGKVIWDIKPRRQKYSNISLQLILKKISRPPALRTSSSSTTSLLACSRRAPRARRVRSRSLPASALLARRSARRGRRRRSRRCAACLCLRRDESMGSCTAEGCAAGLCRRGLRSL